MAIGQLAPPAADQNTPDPPPPPPSNKQSPTPILVPLPPVPGSTAAKPNTSTAEAHAAAVPQLPPSQCDFDVLMVCDCRRHWYSDADGSTERFKARLLQALAPYSRRMFLGTSMGGFAALLFAEHADVTLVFGPQVCHARALRDPLAHPE